VLGRQVESVLVNQLAQHARSMGATVLAGEYIPSQRNAQVGDLYERLGFQDLRWDLTTGDPLVPDWFAVLEDNEAGA
jgi:predicted enzyme involved in methoxymalonyl-ACP biosynthesis